MTIVSNTTWTLAGERGMARKSSLVAVAAPAPHHFFGTPFELALKCGDGLPKIGGGVFERRHSVSPSLFVVVRRRGAQMCYY